MLLSRFLVMLLAAVPALAAPPPVPVTLIGDQFLPAAAPAHVRNLDIRPTWMSDGSLVIRRDGAAGQAWLIVDPTTGNTRPAFDPAPLAAGLAKATGKPVEPGALPFDRFAFTADRSAIDVALGADRYRCTLAGACTALPTAMVDKAPGVFSPDHRWIAYLKDGNLRVRAAGGSEDFALTSDAAEDNGYAGSTGNSTGPISLLRAGVALPPNVRWSPDSRRILTHSIDERGVKPTALLQTVPGNGEVRPRVWSWRYSYPGEPKAMQTLIVFDIASRRRTELRSLAQPLPFTSSIEQFLAWWSPDGRSVWFVERGPNYRTITLKQADAASGVTRVVLSENSSTYLELGQIGAPPMVRTTTAGDLIWYSRRDGFAHLYRYDLKTGALRNRITQGPWTVREILRVDEAAKQIIFTASGREPGRDPYFRKAYAIGFDGRGLKLLTPEDSDHDLGWAGAFVADPLDLGIATDAMSPRGDYFVDTHSRADLPPVHDLRRADGSLVATLAKAELVDLDVPKAAWPEPFVALAADGKTKLYGTLYRPARFDATRKYPLVDSIYGAPQMRRVDQGFVGQMFDRGGAMMLAQRGMITFILDGRGTPDRSEAFLMHAYGKLDNPGLDDHVAVIRQLAERYPFIDVGRVGIYGVSGGGFATARALFTRPDVFKVGVASEGNHDQRGYLAVWGETYEGPDDGKNFLAAANAEFAAGLQGKLLLIHGDMDDNVHLGHTMQVVDALIKANKDFELLIVPNANHGGYRLPYVWRRTGDFLVRELGAEK